MGRAAGARPGRPGTVDTLGLHSGQVPNPGTGSRTAGGAGQAPGTLQQSWPAASQFAGTWEDVAIRNVRTLSRDHVECVHGALLVCFGER